MKRPRDPRRNCGQRRVQWRYIAHADAPSNGLMKARRNRTFSLTCLVDVGAKRGAVDQPGDHLNALRIVRHKHTTKPFPRSPWRCRVSGRHSGRSIFRLCPRKHLAAPTRRRRPSPPKAPNKYATVVLVSWPAFACPVVQSDIAMIAEIARQFCQQLVVVGRALIKAGKERPPCSDTLGEAAGDPVEGMRAGNLSPPPGVAVRHHICNFIGGRRSVVPRI